MFDDAMNLNNQQINDRLKFYHIDHYNAHHLFLFYPKP